MIGEDLSATITTDTIYRAYQARDHSPSWTFKTAGKFKIGFKFHVFDIRSSADYLEIGDGLEIKQSTVLVHFSGRTLPSNVTSISNCAWMKVMNEHWRRVGAEPMHLELDVTIVKNTGVL